MTYVFGGTLNLYLSIFLTYWCIHLNSFHCSLFDVSFINLLSINVGMLQLCSTWYMYLDSSCHHHHHHHHHQPSAHHPLESNASLTVLLHLVLSHAQ